MAIDPIEPNAALLVLCGPHLNTNTSPMRSTTIALSTLLIGPAMGQELPAEMYLEPATHRLLTGGLPSTGLYAKPTIRTLDLQFAQPNYWTLMQQNYDSQTDLPATLTVDGVVYDSVGVRFKGQTSYNMLPPGSQKRSFNLTLDHAIEGQELLGYETLNLNNAFQDPSFLREVVYLDLIRDHVPAAKANFVHLNINGASWGLYPSVQQLNSDFLREWYFSNDGSLWRADRPPGSGGGWPGPGGQWGDGTAALNDLGTDTASYQEYYTLKRSERASPWEDLVRVCQVLGQVPLNALEDSLRRHLDVDRTLWFLATEIAFADDDGYVHKGKMDYYLYFDTETERMTPLEYDGNSVMKTSAANWSAFYHANDANYPLLNRLLAVPSMRQRYLAHLRTLIQEKMQSTSFNALLSSYSTLIDAEVQADPKKLYTYTAFTNELIILQNFITTRRNNLMANTEVAQVAPVISGVSHRVNEVEWADPLPSESTTVTASITGAASRVDLFHCPGAYGTFARTEMYDDGTHGDGAAGDGVFGAQIPPAPGQTRVRYYVMATGTNAAQSVSFDPPGAEHDVYTYLVQVEFAVDPAVRINEVMAQNTTGAQDEAGQYEDWIELYNNGSEPFDLGGGWLSDDGNQVYKWRIPDGTVIGPNGYLIIWADEDHAEGLLHANFKLAASGEEVWLAASSGVVLDHLSYGEQTANTALARIPNGTGPFVQQGPTFAANNELTTGIDRASDTAFLVFPNPANERITITVDQRTDVVIRDALQREVWRGTINGTTTLATGSWSAGSYSLHTMGGTAKLVVLH